MIEFDAYKIAACLDVLIKAAQTGMHIPNVIATVRRELRELDAALEPKPAEYVAPSAIPSTPEPELDLGNTRRI